VLAGAGSEQERTILDTQKQTDDVIRFTPISAHQAGIVFALLSKSWKSLWNPELENKLRNFDRDVFQNPATVGACTFVTCVAGEPVGMASYDPRQGPEVGIIGYNCVVPNHQRRGYGKQQVHEILRIFRQRHFKKAFVSTGDDPFFVPAQRMYQACGFREARREAGRIDYEKILL
jgi:GNAT superfamily N-acetyltransferase